MLDASIRKELDLIAAHDRSVLALPEAVLERWVPVWSARRVGPLEVFQGSPWVPGPIGNRKIFLEGSWLPNTIIQVFGPDPDNPNAIITLTSEQFERSQALAGASFLKLKAAGA